LTFVTIVPSLNCSECTLLHVGGDTVLRSIADRPTTTTKVLNFGTFLNVHFQQPVYVSRDSYVQRH